MVLPAVAGQRPEAEPGATQVCVFTGATVLRLFSDLEYEVDTETAVKVTGFVSTVQIVAIMIVFNFSTLLIAGHISAAASQA